MQHATWDEEEEEDALPIMIAFLCWSIFNLARIAANSSAFTLVFPLPAPEEKNELIPPAGDDADGGGGEVNGDVIFRHKHKET